VDRTNPQLRRRLTPVGVRFLLAGLLTSVFATVVSSRPLLALGLGTALLPLMSFVTLPSPAGRVLTRMPIRMQAGVPAPLHVDIVRGSARSGAPLLIAVEVDGWPPLTAWSEAQARDAKACLDFQVTPPSRGLISRWQILTMARDPLGFAQASVISILESDQVHIVQPATVPAPALPTPPTSDIPEFSGLRAWQPGDRPRDVDWRATARRPSTAPVVRLWSATPVRGGELVIGVAGGSDEQACERIAELAAAAVREALHRYEKVTLRWAGGELTAPLAEPLLDALAAVPAVGMPSPADCDVLIAPSTDSTADVGGGGLGGAGALWRVDGSGRVVAA
jgi:uncharacterized protein (DUF58 family)